jgi:hypothetical protein
MKWKIGDIIYNSWGYGQTNIDFAIVTKVREKSVTIERIGKKEVKRIGLDSYLVEPNPEDKNHRYSGERPMVKKIYHGEEYLKAEFGLWFKYTRPLNETSYY